MFYFDNKIFLIFFDYFLNLGVGGHFTAYKREIKANLVIILVFMFKGMIIFILKL